MRNSIIQQFTFTQERLPSIHFSFSILIWNQYSGGANPHSRLILCNASMCFFIMWISSHLALTLVALECSPSLAKLSMGRVEWQWWVSRTINVPWYQCVSSLREYQVLLIWICTHTGCTFPSLGKFVLCEVAVTRVSREQLILIPGYSEKASPAKCLARPFSPQRPILQGGQGGHCCPPALDYYTPDT